VSAASHPHVAVVGGGISGLAAAERLGRAGVRVSLLEGSSRVGGKLATGEVAGVGVDIGAESVLARRREAVELAERCGLGDQIVHPATAGAFVWTRRRLRPLPSGTLMGIPGDLRALSRSQVLTLPELLRVPLDRVLPVEAPQSDVALGTYVAKRMGHGVVDRLVEPLLGGVYAGHAERISFEAALPDVFERVRAGARLLDVAAAALASGPATAVGARPAAEREPVFASWQGGLGRLPEAVARVSGAQVRTGVSVRDLVRLVHGWRLEVDGAGSDGRRALDVDAVVLAVPAAPAARLLSSVAAEAAGALAAIPYASVALVTYALCRRDLPSLPTGTGFLVPPSERRLIKASTLSSVKWGWLARQAPDLVFARVSVGRFGEERDLHRDDDDLAADGLEELALALGWPQVPRPVDVRVDRWGGALPQYLVGHRDRVARARRSVAEQPGLAVCGAAYDGVGIPACVASGARAAEEVLAWLAASPDASIGLVHAESAGGGSSAAGPEGRG